MNDEWPEKVWVEFNDESETLVSWGDKPRWHAVEYLLATPEREAAPGLAAVVNDLYDLIRSRLITEELDDWESEVVKRANTILAKIADDADH